MELQPPHLPKKQGLLINATSWQSIFYFVSFLLISILASLATVFVALNYIIPRAVPDVKFYTIEHTTTQKNPSLSIDDASLIGRISERQISLIDKRKQRNAAWNTLGSTSETGYLLTSDGWVVFPLSLDAVPDKKNFEAVDSHGTVYPFETFLVDTKLGLLYAKIKGDGFRFVSFRSGDILDTLISSASPMAVLGDQYLLASFTGSVKNPNLLATETEIWKPQYISTFSVANAESIFTTSGEFVGLLSKGVFVPGWYIQNGLESILESKTLSYSGFTWKGEFVESQKQNGLVKSLSGFYITADTLEKDGLKVGDVITKINNEEFTPETITHALLAAPQNVVVELIRDGKTLQKTFQKQAIRP